MATKQIDVPGIGTVTLYKRRGSRHIRLSVTATGKVRVTMPTWVPYQAGIEFAKQKQTWLAAQRPTEPPLQHGMPIGKEHRLQFEAVAKGLKISSRLASPFIRIKVPRDVAPDSAEVQAICHKAAIRALKQEAEGVLPGRLRRLAQAHGFNFRSVEVKHLKSRWGSCNHRQEIVLNCFLMQLPWPLIDYVLLHELVHTKIMAHGPKFWQEMSRHVPDLASIRKQMRTRRPLLHHVNTSGMP